MQYAIIEAKIYQWSEGKGKVKPDYIIMRLYDGVFLEWRDIKPIGVEEIDGQIVCDGSLVIQSYDYAEKIITALGGTVGYVR
ncbi:MAG: hypothetical protein EPO24_01895 [Bacteroidetes bacterium]|nr:MAG: hypothetical protein EPO24_01895 [Bacteroidota bacterium]